jgi:hypothetical protein
MSKPQGVIRSEGLGKLTKLIHLIGSRTRDVPASLDPGVYSAYDRNEYQKQKNNVSGEWGSTDAKGWQPYRHLWAACLDNVG